jgi:hypothetical protein
MNPGAAIGSFSREELRVQGDMRARIHAWDYNEPGSSPRCT